MDALEPVQGGGDHASPVAPAKAPSSVLDEIAQVSEILMRTATRCTIRSALEQSEITQIFLTDAGGQGFLALCEVQTRDGDTEKAHLVTQVEVTTRLTGMADRDVASCILWTRKHLAVPVVNPSSPRDDGTTASTTPSAAGQLPSVSSVKELNVQTLSLTCPLEELQQQLTRVYDPLCHQQRDASIRSTMQELVSAIKSKDSVMADFRIQRYVHSELLALCTGHPNMDVRQLVEALGPKASDVTFLKDVQQVRNKCLSVLEADMHVREVTSVRDEISHWQSMLEWLEDAQHQVQTREWKLVQKVLDRRVDNAAEAQLPVKSALVKEYIKILQAIPVSDIASAKDEKDVVVIARRISETTTRSGKYPARRMIVLMELMMNDVVDKLLELAAKRQVLSLKPTEEAFPYLRSLRAFLTELQQLYRQQYELVSRKTCAEYHQKTQSATERVRRLQEFIDEHYGFYDSLKRVFTTGDNKQRFVDQLERLHSQFSAAVADILWRLDERGTAAFLQAAQTYERAMQHAEEEIALLVKSMLAGAPNTQEMYRTHAQFRNVKRPTIRAVINQFRVPLLEMIASGLKDVQDKFLDVVSAQRSIRVSMASGLSSLAARIVWEKSVEQAISQLLVKRDSLSDYGWHQLLSHQTLERRWRLTEPLLQYMAVSMQDVVRLDPNFAKDSEVHGTALALAYLEMVYPDDQLEWEKDGKVRMAKTFLRQHDQATLDKAKAILTSVLSSNRDHSKEREQMKDARNARSTILKNVDDDAHRWLHQVHHRIAQLDVVNGLISKAVYTVEENNATGKRELGISIPVEFNTWLTDIKYLSALKIVDTEGSSGGGGQGLGGGGLRGEVAFFFEKNQQCIARAAVLRSIVEAFNALMAEDNEGTIPTLLQAEYAAVHRLFQQASSMSWKDDSTVERHVRQLSDALAQLTTAAENIRKLTTVAGEHMDALSEDHCSPHEIRHHVHEIRMCINTISLKTPNALPWVRTQLPKLEKALVFQLQGVVKEWTAQFKSLSTDHRFLEDTAETVGFRLKPLRVSMRVVQRQVQLESTAPQWRNHWYAELNKAFVWLNDIPSLDMLHNINVASSVLGESHTLTQKSTYHRLIDRLPAASLREPMDEIERCIDQAIAIERQWQGSQQFLNLDIALVQEKLGDDLKQWLVALQRIRAFSLQQMDGTQPSSLLGGIVILSEEAQRELGKKMDQMNHYLNVKFCEKAEQKFDSAYRAIMAQRTEVEAIPVAEDNTKGAMQFLCALPKYSKFLHEKEQELQVLVDTELHLKRQSFRFPDGWVFSSRIKDAFRTLKEVLDRKNTTVDGCRESLIASLKDSVARLEHHINDVDRKARAAELDGTKRLPPQALEDVRNFLMDATRLHEEANATASSQSALGQDVFNSPKLDALVSDLQGLKTTWEHVLGIHEELCNMGQRPFFEVSPRNVLNDLIALEVKMANFPDITRTFHAYRDMSGRITKLKSYHKLLQDLRSDAMAPLDRAERHWTALKSQLRQSSWVLHALTLQDFWNTNPSANSKIYHSVLEAAQGERRLESQLQQVSSFWLEHTLETVYYQNKVALVKGWDALFERLGEDLNSLTAMRLSPFFKAQQIVSVAHDWDKKLNSVRQVLEVLLDVQRRWVYLDGIFSGSVEIRHQLPSESSQFDRTSRDFIGLMPKAKQGPLTAVKFVEDERMLSALEKIALQLTQIQRALGEYLDTQRSRFPRFYFVGDDDLLEVIGSGKDPLQVSKHLKKMFAGVNAAVLSPDATSVVAVQSSEGEVVTLNDPVDPRDKAVYEWLSILDEHTRETLKASVTLAVQSYGSLTAVTEWISKFPSQVAALAAQIAWVAAVEDALHATTTSSTSSGADASPLGTVETSMVALLGQLATDVMTPTLSSSLRHKAEQIITVAVYQRDTSRALATARISSSNDFEWLRRMRPYYSAKSGVVTCRMADADLDYSYEYLGMQERLVQTSLTDKCFLTLTQALHARLGGSPSGPAGTGKTETVKALGCQLGRFTLVFNCDETFDFKSMGRIFVGLCQVGAWGCFDEFNRLEERILSAVSQQIQGIQDALRLGNANAGLDGKKVVVHTNTGIFITMNPGYAGRSNLPDNLKQLFRSVAMITPDRENIAEVMLFAQGFKSAEVLSRKVVPLFRLCKDQLSHQSHYDFGLRALKSVLVSAGNLKRGAIARGENDLSAEDEQRLLMQSLTETIVPKLVAEDVALFFPLIGDVFPGLTPVEEPMDRLKAAITTAATSHGYTPSTTWVAKILQLYKILHVNHGIMLVGSSGCGKSSAWMTLLRALAQVEDVDGHAYVMDPKAVSKAELYGVLDTTSREWKDGIFTATLRKIVDNVKGDDQQKKRHWIIFDGDVDPEWVENLNSLLDDNRLFTLPNGERLTLPSNVRILFEVQSLRFATPATVSRCGMIWFSADTLSVRHMIDNGLHHLKHRPFTAAEDTLLAFAERSSSVEARLEKRKGDGSDALEFSVEEEQLLELQRTIIGHAEEMFNPGGFVERALHTLVTKYAAHGIMEYTEAQSIRSMMTLFAQSAWMVRQRNEQHSSDMNPASLKAFVQKRVVFACLWGFGSMLSVAQRTLYAQDLHVEGLPNGVQLLDVEVDADGNWSEWRKRVTKTEIQPDKVGTNDIVIPTIDTTRHEDIISSWLRTGKPVILCGPPGSGKTMSLTAVLRASPHFDAVFLNFSSATSPDTILKTLLQYCVVKNTLRGFVMSPLNAGKKLIVFCDEINLPSLDKYGTQRVVQFMRQLTEQQGFYRAKDNQWIHLEHVQFVGACNPPSDPGRVPLTQRFLRWAPVLFVDFPSFESLQSIYETYCRAMFYKSHKMLAMSPHLSKAMVAFFKASQERFTADIQRHYVYSPRELSRWSRAIYEGILSLDDVDQKNIGVEDVARLAVHEGLRIFRDRLTTEAEEEWTDDAIDKAFFDNFVGLSSSALQRPILYSTIFTRAYASAEREQLRTKLRERIREFRDEEVDVELVVFDAVVDHVIRIDRVLRQPLGHMLLVGSSGVGKTVLSRFVAWLNHLSVFQVKAHRGYTLSDFEEDLRSVMRRAGCKREKICFIFDESNIMDSNFLEYMNALLASGEVPGLFDGDSWPKLMQAIREGVSTSNSSDFVDTTSEQDLYRWFIRNVQLYLHVVFTMNPSYPDFHNRSATSPALFNRCTIDWFGDWTVETTFHVAHELCAHVDVMFASNGQHKDCDDAHNALATCINRMHQAVLTINADLRLKNANSGTFITPRHFLDFIRHFHGLFREKRNAVEDLQRHLNSGLSKLRETSLIVDQQQRELEEKERILAESGKKAQQMLETIITETDKAKRGKQEATELKAFLEKESVRITEDRAKVEHELADAEPALKDAEAALNTIKPENIRELRAYATPPPMVKKVLEAVVILLGEKRASDWEVIKSYTRKDDFISQVKAFRPSNITDDARDKIKKNYVGDDNFTYENAQRASKAAGPLFKWVTAQVRYSDIFASVGPLRSEIDRLASQYDLKLKGLEQAEVDIQANEASIERLKATYQTTTEENSRIKMEISTVASRCNRAKNLMENLLAEKNRWEEQSASFHQQTMCVMGDCLLAAAFLAYIGYFDEQHRRNVILPEWQDIVDACSIAFRREMSIVEYLSLPEKRLEWSSHRLPQDNLCIENAIIMERYQRYPLVIDPSGQAVEFLLQYLQPKKIAKTSFVEKGFMKQLENAVRFGYPILIQDVENIDPVLNPLLNQEVRRVGGRQLIRIGPQDVDMSPSFALYLSTRDATFQFSPDVCGRVTIVNFTATLSSLQSQCLHHVMLHERPDVDEKRSDLMKLQGEYRARLRTLEQDLLTAISVSEGNILENEQLIKTLETLKTESSDIEEKFRQSETSFEEISAVEAKYAPLAKAASKLYFSLETLRELDETYLFSLRFFLKLLEASLSALPPTSSQDDRIPIIARQLFVVAHRRVTRSMFEKHHTAIALRLAQLRSAMGDAVGAQIQRAEWDVLLATAPLDVVGSAAQSNLQGLPKELLSTNAVESIQELLMLPSCSTLRTSMEAASSKDAWRTFLTCGAPLQSIPEGAISSAVGPAKRAFMAVLLAKCLRRDAYDDAARQFLRAFFDEDMRGASLSGSSPGFEPFYSTASLQLADVLPELSSSTPLLLVSTAGYDASGRVEELANGCNRTLLTVAMGSPEGYDEAERFVSQSMKQGGWVLLKNVHLASKFLSSLEKRLHGETLENKINKQFQLFLSSERSAKTPPGLITSSVVVVLEPPPGVKASLIRTIGSMSASSMPQNPKELFPRLFFAAAWLHAVVTERMHYVPLGWSKRYEFSESDFRRVVDTIVAWVQRIRGERQNVPPSELPWAAIRRLVAETIYGGKIDNEFDDVLLETFCSTTLSEALFQQHSYLVQGDESMKVANVGLSIDEIKNWIQQLPDQQPPAWLGLPAHATSMVLQQRANFTVESLAKIQNLQDDDVDASNQSFSAGPQRSARFVAKEATPAPSSSSHGNAARWASKLSIKVQDWQRGLEAVAPVAAVSAAADPIVAALQRDRLHGQRLRTRLLTELSELSAICKNELKPTNDHRKLIDALLRDQVPTSWRTYSVPPSITVSAWMVDLCKRLHHIASLTTTAADAAAGGERRTATPIALGYLFFPEALLTASRQSAARATKAPLEKLFLAAHVFDDHTAKSVDVGSVDASVVYLQLVTIQSGAITGTTCHSVDASKEAPTALIPLLKLSWTTDAPPAAAGRSSSSTLRVPFYLNDLRTEVLTTLNLPVEPLADQSRASWLQKGVCLFAWNSASI